MNKNERDGEKLLLLMHLKVRCNQFENLLAKFNSMDSFKTTGGGLFDGMIHAFRGFEGQAEEKLAEMENTIRSYWSLSNDGE